MLRFASQEYMEEVQRRTNVDSTYLSLSKGETVSYTMVIDPDPGKQVMERTIVGYRTDDGKIAEIWMGERPTEMTIAAPYGVWVDVILGKVSVTRAFLTRRLRLKGNLAQILKMSKSTDRWLVILRQVPTEFAGLYAANNIPGTP